jgi:23S rRNA (cytosine1962-C5)-methyltransferase
VEFLVNAPPCIIFEDDDLLVVNKPAGMNTHAPGPFAGEGIYEWLRHREPRWADLAIIHRLDKETSGVMVFGKTKAANRSLTEQFTQHTVRKQYRLLTDRPVKRGEFRVVSSLVRAGEKYLSRPAHAGGERAETVFRKIGIWPGRQSDEQKVTESRPHPGPLPQEREKSSWTRQGIPGTHGKIPLQNYMLLEAEPVTGRTHQIRAQAAAEGFPILGDTLYGGTDAPRVCLHSAVLTLKHPATGAEVRFEAPADFDADARLALRMALVDARETDAFRLIHGAADGWPGWHVERLEDFLLSQSEHPLDAARTKELGRLMKQHGGRGAYHKILTRQVRHTGRAQASPQHALGGEAPEEFAVRENGVLFGLSFAEGYSTGLFLDQRDNRRRLLTNHVAAGFPVFLNGASGAEVLNTFAYTCGFSVCAAKAGARTTSLDLSKKYLAWGRRNFERNGLDAAKHEFVFGDAFDWLRRLAKKGRVYDVVLLDPPTFSQSKDGGAFRAEADYDRLVETALRVLKTGGVLFASTNAARLAPEDFLKTVEAAVKSARRKILKQHYVPQPPDFPVHRDDPAYLKTVWLKMS